MSYYIGIDLGTSSVKAILATEMGEIVDRTGYSYNVVTDSSGLSEIDPEIWYKGIMCCLIRLTEDVKNIKAIGVTGQMHSLTLIGEDEKAIRPTMMWNDLRTKDQVNQLKMSAEKSCLDYISEIISTGSPAANLLFVKENEPDNFKKIKKLLIGHDYATYRLTGHAGADYCEASTSSLYDIENRCWASTMLDYIGIDISVMPEILPSCRKAGRLKSEICAELGLTEIPSVAEGTGDNTASVISMSPPCISLGTSGVFIERQDALRKGKKGKNILFSLNGEAPSVIVQGVVQAVGSSMEWLKSIVGAGSVKEMLERIPNKTDERLLFYPHLNGDKTLYRDSSLRGAFLGLSLATDKKDIVTAAVEGICFAIRQMMEQVSANTANVITVTGGLAESRVFMQTLANVLECKLKTVEDNPGAVYGAALMAIGMEGKLPKPKNAQGHIYRPDGSMTGYYRKKYKSYLKIHDILP